MCLDPGALEFLNHKTPARGGFQRECRPLVVRKAREPAAQVLAGGGTDLSAKEFAGLCLYAVEGDLLPMHVQSTYNVHPGPPQAPSADNNALMISGSSAFELRRLLYMSSFLSRSVRAVEAVDCPEGEYQYEDGAYGEGRSDARRVAGQKATGSLEYGGGRFEAGPAPRL